MELTVTWLTFSTARSPVPCGVIGPAREKPNANTNITT